MSNFLNQWQQADSPGDWESLHQSLQQALLSNHLETLLPQLGVDRVLHLAITVLEEGDFQERWEIVKLLPTIGDRAIPPLINLLQDEEADLEARWFVARTLGEFKSPTAMQALVELLQSTTDADLSLMAASALAKSGQGAIDALTHLLATPETRLAAVRALVQVNSPAITEPLLQVADDPDPTVRSLVLEALGRFPDSRVLAVLLKGLDDPVTVVKRAAIVSLATYPVAAPPESIERLGKCLYDLNLEVCKQAAIALGRVGNPQALGQLFRVLTSRLTPLPLQIDCLRAIAWNGSLESLQLLQQVLTSNTTVDPELYRETVMVLGRWSKPALHPEVAQLLLDLLATHHPAIHSPAMKQALSLALGYLGQPDAIVPLTQLLADPDAGVRLHAIAALKTLDAQASHCHLTELASQPELPDALQRGVTIALQEWEITHAG